MTKLLYILGCLIIGPIVLVVSTLFCPIVMFFGLIWVAREGWKKNFPPKVDNFGLTPPPKEIVVLN